MQEDCCLHARHLNSQSDLISSSSSIDFASHCHRHIICDTEISSIVFLSTILPPFHLSLLLDVGFNTYKLTLSRSMRILVEMELRNLIENVSIVRL